MTSARSPFPLRTCVQVCLGFVATAAAFHLWPHDPCAVLNPVTGVEDPLSLHPELAEPKRPGETRVLFVGASLTFGYPYGLHASYATVLEAGLRAVFPDRRILVKPIAKPAIDSTRVADMVEAVLRAAPDIVFTDFGGNELGARIFLERDLVPQDWLGRLSDHGTRSRNAFLALAPRDNENRAFAAGDVFGKVVNRLLDARPAQPLVQALPVPPRDREILAARTRESMRRMAAAARAAGVPLVFMVSPYDLAGSWPRGMVERARDVDAAVHAYRRGATLDRAAVEALARAHPGRADAQFLLGQMLRAAGESARARAALELARDLDPAPLHTIGPIARAIIEEGEALGLPVLTPDDATVRDASGIQDPACYLDAAHWNLEGARQGAAYFAEQLAARGIVPSLPAGWRATFDAAARAWQDVKVDAKARAYCTAEMARATGAYHMLFGNVREGVFALAEGVQWFTGIVEGPQTTMWVDWATRVIFCAAAAVDRVDDLMTGSPEARVARISALCRALWDAGEAGRALDVVWRVIDGEPFDAIARK